jgi:hypothetical protein
VSYHARIRQLRRSTFESMDDIMDGSVHMGICTVGKIHWHSAYFAEMHGIFGNARYTGIMDFIGIHGRGNYENWLFRLR